MKLRPPAPPGRFYSYDWWHWTLGSSCRIKSAERGGALIMERRGPRGGAWFMVHSMGMWKDWARVFNERCRKQHIGRRAAVVERAILRG